MKNEILPRVQEEFESALLKGRILSFEDVSLGAEEWLSSLGRELDA